jgi:pimeloyl-ACP methyl ester carboxylesterase
MRPLTVPAAVSIGLLSVAAVVGLRDACCTTLAPHRAEWRRADDVLVRTVTLGTGDTTLVLLHGYGESLLAWRGVAEPLARRYRVVAFDLPGFGVSDKPASGYDLATMTVRISDLVRRTGHGPVVLAGHSMGGELAASVALSHPELVRQLVLIAPAGAGLSNAAGHVPDALRALIGATTPAVLGVHDPRWLAEPPGRMRYDPTGDPAYRAALTRITRDFDFAGIGARYGALRMPVLLVWGQLDPTIPVRVGHALHTTIPRSCLVVLDRGLHRPHEATPDTVAELVRQFVETGGGCPPGAAIDHRSTEED